MAVNFDNGVILGGFLCSKLSTVKKLTHSSGRGQLPIVEQQMDHTSPTEYRTSSHRCMTLSGVVGM